MSHPPASPTSASDRLRLDKWLWAARFFKTRALACAAVSAGHVRLGGQGIKPAREVRCGDTLDILVGENRWTIVIQGINPLRRPASEAQQLYRESEESVARRQAQQEARRLAPVPGSDLRGRPTKKARRQIHGFNTGN